ncbi:hypothetical protein GDO78_018721 [Eleutherodactylus coqui]|uniref:Uncharacterized protein n=1 Tax=Eleutherodactylus coqui TaxID=57060 RepID=A0A8J6EAX4_ELECQ|nr:hypothetical protein GDO78_018721 [Eleutherodactylus coqui]
MWCPVGISHYQCCCRACNDVAVRDVVQAGPGSAGVKHALQYQSCGVGSSRASAAGLKEDSATFFILCHHFRGMKKEAEDDTSQSGRRVTPRGLQRRWCPLSLLHHCQGISC